MPPRPVRWCEQVGFAIVRRHARGSDAVAFEVVLDEGDQREIDFELVVSAHDLASSSVAVDRVWSIALPVSTAALRDAAPEVLTPRRRAACRARRLEG
jgi:hypothetical protein